MIETILGGLLGGITRIAPEVMKFLDRKNERKHELELIDKNIAADQARVQGQLKLADAQAASAQFTSALDALKEAVKGQAALTGSKIIDGINALVRPGVTYIVFGMWTCVKLASLATLIHGQPDVDGLATAIKLWWLPDDQAMLAAILNFWFMGRVFDKALR